MLENLNFFSAFNSAQWQNGTSWTHFDISPFSNVLSPPRVRRYRSWYAHACDTKYYSFAAHAKRVRKAILIKPVGNETAYQHSVLLSLSENNRSISRVWKQGLFAVQGLGSLQKFKNSSLAVHTKSELS